MAIGATGVEELGRALTLNAYLWSQTAEAGVFPWMRSWVHLHRGLSQALTDAQGTSDWVGEVGSRVRAGVRFNRLVQSLGRQLFGSATFEGERCLAEDDIFRLSYLPPTGGRCGPGVSLFHAGGFLPYSDRIFRILPEANLFRSFVDRGVPVYAMELKGDGRSSGEVGAVTLDGVIDAIARLSRIAFHHEANRDRKMILEGYCGLGMPSLAYVAARPAEADARFKLAVTMVAPVDARACTLAGELIRLTPERLLALQTGLSGLLGGGYVRGGDLRLGMDIPLGTLVYKSPLGRFVSGWDSPAYADVHELADLNPVQRRELAGAYWISPENAKRYPLPVDLVRFFLRLFSQGVQDDLTIPACYRGQPLSLRTILEHTGIRLVGFYGGRDRVVPDATAQVLVRQMGDRYTHVVHPRAGHISYVLSPELWDPAHPAALDPNPLDLMLELYSKDQN